MSIIIHREDKDYGPYSLEEVKDLVLKGVLTQDDLARAKEDKEWVPLKTLLSQVSSHARTTLFAASRVSPPEEKALGTNRPSARGYLIGALLLVLMMSIFVAAVIELKKTLAPFLALMDIKSATESSPGVADKSVLGPFSTSVTLPSGTQIKILSIKQEENEGRQVLCLHYISHVDIHDRQQLNPEVDQVWPLFKHQADQSGLNWAVISPTVIISTFPVESSEYENYYYKKTDGNWELDFPKH
jgi:hypothetical protein